MVQAAPLNMGFREDTIAGRDGLSRLREIVERSDGPVLADETMGLLPLEGRRIQLQPFEMTRLARESKWEQEPLLRRISDKQYSAVLIFEPPGAGFLVEERWTAGMLDGIEANYEPAETLAGTTVYRPRE